MAENISIIGGDLRIAKLAEMLAKDKYKVKTFAIENADCELKKCNTIKEAVQNTDIVIGPIPLSKNNTQINTPFSDKTITIEELAKELRGKKFIAGSIKKEFYEYAKKYQIETIDILKREELAILNTIATAEGAIQIAMEETKKTLHSSNVLVLGFGRVGKILANKLKQIGVNLYCTARKNVDLAWIKAYGYNGIPIENLNENLDKFDIIINTIPALILKEKEIINIKKECLIIDLASIPGGIDQNISQKQGKKVIWALALPGKVAPITSAEYIKDTLYNIMEEYKL